jgi:tetratricopeptide (TPR) repeat protein
MDKPFRLRFANEIAGAFVLAAFALILAGIFVAGRAQGWFEGHFTVHAPFLTEEGSFGLKEGSEIIARNTPVGRVGRIVPDANGTISAELVIRERFHPFIRTDSVGKVRRKLGLAGDAYVDISVGRGDPIPEGATLVCSKDRELMETVQNVLTNVQNAVVPMAAEARQILEHVNGILVQVEKGDGTLGTLLHDRQLAQEVKDVVTSADTLLRETRQTAHETTRLVKGIQRHWMFRKYVEQDLPLPLVLPAYLSPADARESVAAACSQLRTALQADDAIGIARTVYNLVGGLGALGSTTELPDLSRIAAFESAAGPETKVLSLLVDASCASTRGDTPATLASAQKATEALDRSCADDVHFAARLQAAQAYLSAGQPQQARAELERAARVASGNRQKARLLQITALLPTPTPDARETARQLDEATRLLHESEAYFGMAGVLADAADAHASAGDPSAASARFMRAWRSYTFAGLPAQAATVVARANARGVDTSWVTPLGSFHDARITP